MWQPGGGGKNKKCHLSENAEVVPVSEPPKKVVPVFESGKRSCQYLIITLKVVPLYDVNPIKQLDQYPQKMHHHFFCHSLFYLKNLSHKNQYDDSS